jgi:4'-phosphopantetheinyl transferase
VHQLVVWNNGRSAPQLDVGDVHVWRLDTEDVRHSLSSLVSLLTVDERQRASKFKFKDDSETFVAAHSALRILVARYLGTLPASVGFEKDHLGKPQLDSAAYSEHYRFNISHTNGTTLIAISRGIEVGIDVEAIRKIERRIAEQQLTQDELKRISTLPVDDWMETFYTCWTRKEAVLKGEGLGLRIDPGLFEVAVVPGKQAKLITSDPCVRFTRDWHVIDVGFDTLLVGSLAMSPMPKAVNFYRYDTALYCDKTSGDISEPC